MTNAERLLHEAHLRYQRQQLARDTTRAVQPLESTEVRDVRFRYSLPEWLQAQRLEQRRGVLTGLRSRFWSAYLDTIVFMSK